MKDLARKPANRERERDSVERRDPSERAHALQRAAGNQATAALAGEVASLTPDARAKLERAYGIDLGRVRIHSGRAAGEEARSQRTIAFTRGTDVYLGDRAAGDERVLAHELGHVVQQSDAAAAVPKLPGAVLEAEAAGGEVTVGAATPGSVQGWPGDEEEEVKPPTAQEVDALVREVLNDRSAWKRHLDEPTSVRILQSHSGIRHAYADDPEFRQWIQHPEYRPPGAGKGQAVQGRTAEMEARQKAAVKPTQSEQLVKGGRELGPLKGIKEFYGEYQRRIDEVMPIFEAIPGGKLGRVAMEMALGRKMSGAKVDRREKSREVSRELLLAAPMALAPEAGAVESEGGAAAGAAEEEALAAAREPEVIIDEPHPEPFPGQGVVSDAPPKPATTFEMPVDTEAVARPPGVKASPSPEPFSGRGVVSDAPPRPARTFEMAPDTEAVARPSAVQKPPPGMVMAGEGTSSSASGLATEKAALPRAFSEGVPAAGPKAPLLPDSAVGPELPVPPAATQAGTASVQAPALPGSPGLTEAQIAAGAAPAARMATPDVTPRSFPGPKKKKGKQKLPGVPGKDVVEPTKPEPVKAPPPPHSKGEMLLPPQKKPEPVEDEQGESEEPGRRGLKIEISQRRWKRLKKAEEMAKKGGKWPDLPSDDRSGLGRAYNAIIQKLVREIASGGRARVLHYVHVNKTLIAELRKQGGRVVITEGRLYGGKLRFDIAEIDFDKKTPTIELFDLTSMQDKGHAEGTADYADALEKLTGFPVSAYEVPYVGEDGQLLDDLVPIPVQRGKK